MTNGRAGTTSPMRPRIWRRIFDTWGDAVGMNYDPSHLVWQMIDAARFVREFGPRMVHVHAKDLMIDRDGLYDHGIMSAGHGLAGSADAGPGRG
jgi:sugar phosphate isomerase/epimerase